MGQMGVDPDAKWKEQCAIKVLGERVPGPGRTGDVAVDVTNTARESEDFGRLAFRLRHDPVTEKQVTGP